MTSNITPPDMSLRDLSQWAQQQAKRLAVNFGLDAPGSTAYFALAQTVKLGEEVGELHAEVLGALHYHRPDKLGQYDTDTLAGELADVVVCIALLSQILEVDLATAVTEKVCYLEARNSRLAADGRLQFVDVVGSPAPSGSPGRRRGRRVSALSSMSL
jgi:NTP pyrophosphatase (non-canonical NTP hydrolase)